MLPPTRRRLALAPASLALLTCLGCPGAPDDTEGLLQAAPERRDVLLITVDTLRYDATGFSGAGKARTPEADRLAAGGLVFEFAHAHAVITLPSHASMLAGLNPYQHGIRDNAGYVLDDQIPTMATLLRSAGYRTAAFVSAFTLDRRFGLASGFDVYDDEYSGYQGPAFTPAERPGHVTVERALEWWNANRGEPRFLWVHLFTPHFPYAPSEPYASRHADDPYYGDAEMADAELAPLLDTVLSGPDTKTLVVYTSDHGEGLGDHGERTHGLFAYEATLHVPLVIRAEGLVRPGVTPLPARHIDLLPTVLELNGLDPPAGLPGRSLFAGRGKPEVHAAYFEALSSNLNRGWAPLYGRIEGRTKAIQLPIPELYELEHDPGELDNLADRHAVRLQQLLARLPEQLDPAGEREALGPDEIAKLRSLGYLAGSGGPPPGGYDESSDPKMLVALDELLDGALTRYRAGEVEEAIRLMTELVERQPRMPLAYSHLSFFYADLGRIGDAIRVLERAVELGISNESIHRKLALNLVRAGDPAKAWELLSVHRDSADPETQSALGRIAAVRGAVAEAHARFARALELDPSYPTALMDRGTLLLMEDRFEEARTELERALEQDPFLAEAWNALGAIRSRSRDVAGSIAAWRRAIEIDPRLTDALYNLAVALAESGDRSGAIEPLERYVALVGGEERTRAEAMLRGLRP